MHKPTLLLILGSMAAAACGGAAEQAPPATSPPAPVATTTVEPPRAPPAPSVAKGEEPKPAEPAAAAPGFDDGATAVQKLLSGLKADDAAAIASAIYPDVQWRRIPDKLGALRSYELSPADESTDTVTAKLVFPASKVVFAFKTKAESGKWRVRDFRMTEVTQAGVDGVLVSRKGNEIKMQSKRGWLPEVGAQGEFSREIDRSVPLFGGGMVSIARTRVTKVDGDTVTMEMLEELSKMNVNGKKLDHFTKGVHVQLTWGMKVPAP